MIGLGEFSKLKKDKLAEATTIAEEFASRFKRNGVVGIVFLGGIARGYFDKFSDIDIIVFKTRDTKLDMKTEDEIMYKGFLIDYAISNYEDQVESKWSMEARWAFINAKIFYDPQGKTKLLIDSKVPLKDKEKRWMLIEGMTQSKSYCNHVSKSWVFRGDVLSAHYSIYTGLDELLKALFALNKQLFPPKKWRIYQSQNLGWTPGNFSEKLKEIMLMKDVSLEELQRRRESLNYLWKQTLPKAEKEVGMKFDEFSKLV